MNVADAIRNRRSIRRFKPDEIPQKKLERVLDLARRAPSAKNLQPWKFIVVKDKNKKKALVEACKGQAFIAEAPVVIVGCASEKRAYPKLGMYMSSFPVDLAIAMDHLVLAAFEEGLGTCFIGAFYEDEVKKILDIPDEFRVVLLTLLGFPAESPPPEPRDEIKKVVSYEKFEERW